MDDSMPTWRKSRRCESGGCVEFAAVGSGAAVRDSTDPQGPVLRFSRQEWVAFLARLTTDGFSQRS